MNDKEQSRIDAYVWRGLRRYSAMRGTVPLGPARTTMLVALSDAHIKGEKPTTVYDKVTGRATPVNEWKEDGEYTL